MYAITKQFKDLNGADAEETFYFDLTEDEGTELQWSVEGGFAEYALRVMATEDPAKILPMVKQLILKSYGEKDDDGLHFNKKDPVTGRPLSERFAQHVAFSDLWMELATDADKAADFFNGVIPKEENMITKKALQKAMARPADRMQRQKDAQRGRRETVQRNRRLNPVEAAQERGNQTEDGHVGEEATDVEDVELPKILEDYSVIELMRMPKEQRRALEEDFEFRNAADEDE